MTNTTEARHLATGQLVDLDQLPNACLFLWDDGYYPQDRNIATGKHRVTYVSIHAAGKRTMIDLDNGRRLRVRSDRKFVVVDRDLRSQTETVRPVHLQTGASHVRCGLAPRIGSTNPDGWDLSNVVVSGAGVTCPDCLAR